VFQDAFSSASSAPLERMTAVEKATSTDSGCNSVKTQYEVARCTFPLEHHSDLPRLFNHLDKNASGSAGLLTSRRNAIRAPRTPSLVLSRT